MGLFVWAIRNSSAESTRKKALPVLMCAMVWLAIQAVVTMQGVYRNDTASFPPKIMLIGVFPVLLTIILMFATARGRQFIDSLPLKHLTYLNVVRIPVELVLFWLFFYKAVPVIMTFEGRNFDILAGITAPLIAYFGLTKKMLDRRIILFWNFICLGLLMNIVFHAIFSTQTPAQIFAFDQPNIAILHFPFS